MELILAEVKDLATQVGHYIAAYRIATAAPEQNAQVRELATRSAYHAWEIGDRLARELVASCDGLDHLLSKWELHHYRPSLRAARGTPEKVLADVYDLIAEIRGLGVQAYRQGYDADGHR